MGMWELADKLLDNFNFGRAVIYTATGLLCVLPIFMMVELGRPLPEGQTLWEHFIQELARPFEESPFYLFLASYIVGFLVVSAAYPFIAKEQKCLRQRLFPGLRPEDYSVHLNFSLLTTPGAREPLGWLISEYYRFVEIVVYLPLGLLAFLTLLAFYFLLNVPRFHGDALICAMGLMLTALFMILVFRFFWTPLVIRPILTTYMKAKQRLIEGLKLAQQGQSK